MPVKGYDSITVKSALKRKLKRRADSAGRSINYQLIKDIRKLEKYEGIYERVCPRCKTRPGFHKSDCPEALVL
jgi:hypothetical protein